jgi:hypothetical protein
MSIKNNERYSFSDFTLAEYEELIISAKQHYKFTDYISFQNQSHVVLWRHDVDFSMHAALELARIEHKNNVRATYFLLLHSDFYNLLEREISDMVFEIISLGHFIGLHFDSEYYGIKDEQNLIKYLSFEKNILEFLFLKPIDVFSFHNPFAFALSCQEMSYAGMMNTYATIFQDEVGYCSDSNGYWRYRRLKDVLNNASDRNIQVLTHPEWWTKKTLSPFEKVKKCIYGRAENNLVKYNQLLRENNRENIDW